MVTTTTGLATSFITFTRTSNATVTDSNGFIEWAGHNLLLNSESFDSSYWVKLNATVTANLTASPSGATNADTLASSSSVSNTTGVYVNTTGLASGHTMSVFVKAGTSNIAWISGDNGQSYGVFSLSGSGSVLTSANGAASISAVGNSWFLITVANTTVSNAFFIIGGKDTYSSGHPWSNGTWTSGNTIFIWGAHLYRSDLGGMVLNPARGDAYYPTTPRNLLGWTESFDNAAWTKTNILAFGSGSVANAATNPNGLQTADLIVPNATSGVHTVDQISYAIINSTPYQSSVYVKAAGYSKIGLFDNAAANRWATFNLSGSGSVIGNGASATGAITALSDGWYRVSLSENAGTTALAFTIYVLNDAYTSGNPSSYNYAGNGTSGIYLWGAQLSDSASLDAYSPVYDAAVTSAAYYAPRLDFDPVTLAARGLLVEELRANLLLQSNDLANASWTLANAGSRTASTDVAPDGTTSAATITDNISGNFTSVRQTLTVTNNSAAYAASVYIKKTTSASSYPGVSLALTGGTAKYASAALNTTTGVATARTGETPDFLVVSDAGSYWRLSFGITNNTTGNTSLQLDIYAAVNADASATWVAATTGSVVAWGAQLEANASFATSYIPNGSAVAGATRTADVASVSTQAFPYSSTAGSVVVAYDRIGVNRYSRLFNLGDASENNQVSLLNFNVGQENAYFVTGGVAAAVVTGPSVPAVNAASKMGLAFKSGDSAISLNGASATAISSTFTPAATSLYMGGTPVSGQYLNGHIRQITYIPRRLSNSELQARTA